MNNSTKRCKSFFLSFFTFGEMNLHVHLISSPSHPVYMHACMHAIKESLHACRVCVNHHTSRLADHSTPPFAFPRSCMHPESPARRHFPFLSFWSAERIKAFFVCPLICLSAMTLQKADRPTDKNERERESAREREKPRQRSQNQRS